LPAKLRPPLLGWLQSDRSCLTAIGFLICTYVIPTAWIPALLTLLITGVGIASMSGVLGPLMRIGLRCPRLPRADFPLFAHFLAAAWKDLGLPITDHRKRSRLPRTDWFAKRVRKHFTYKTEIAR
jgi:hypothetical protein